MFLKKLFIFLTFLMFTIGFLLPLIVESPLNKHENNYEHSMVLSGLPPLANSLLKALIFTVSISVLFFFFKFQKENNSFRKSNSSSLRRLFILLLSSIVLISILSLAQVVFAIEGLFRINSFEISYLLHSKFFDGLTCLSGSILIILIIWEQIERFFLESRKKF